MVRISEYLYLEVVLVRKTTFHDQKHCVLTMRYSGITSCNDIFTFTIHNAFRKYIQTSRTGYRVRSMRSMR